MSPLKLQSPLAVKIQNLINLRRLSGTDYQSQAQLLGYFDRFLLEQKLTEPRICPKITERYLDSLSHLAPRTRYNRFCVVRQLCEYLARSDPFGYVPEPLKIITPTKARQPYIYRRSQLQTLMAAASKLPPADSLRVLDGDPVEGVAMMVGDFEALPILGNARINTEGGASLLKSENPLQARAVKPARSPRVPRPSPPALVRRFGVDVRGYHVRLHLVSLKIRPTTRMVDRVQ